MSAPGGKIKIEKQILQLKWIKVVVSYSFSYSLIRQLFTTNIISR